MIIEISERFADIPNAEWDKYHIAIENMINAHRWGWHIFAPSRRIANRIFEHCELSRSQKAIFDSHIKDKLTTLVGQARSSDHTILCVPDTGQTLVERANQYAVPMSNFLEPRNLMPCRLLTENAQNDGAFFERLCLILGKYLGYQAPVVLEHLHGGGGTTAAQYKAALDECRPTLCVVDSDQRYPDGPSGSTANAVVAAGHKNACCTVQAHVLPVREAENLIPLSFLFEVYNSNPAVTQIITKFHTFKNSEVCQRSPYRLIDYVDFKEGETKGAIAKIPNPHKAQALNMCAAMGHGDKGDGKYDDVKCKDVAIPAISEKVLPTVISFLDGNKRFETAMMKKIVAAPFWHDLEHIIRLILAFSCGGQKLPV